MEMHKTYNVKPFRYIKIGDPMYLDDIETSKDIKMVKRLKKLVLNQKTPFTNRKTKVIVNTEMVGNRTLDYRIIIYQAKKNFIHKDKVLDCLMKGEMYTDLIKEIKQLGCDTAEFHMFVDNEMIRFNTLSDGYYGTSILLKNNDALCVDISLTADAYSWENVNDIIKHPFTVL